MNNEQTTPKKHATKDFWGFPITHFTYFFTWAIVFGYLTLWLEQEAHFNGVQAGFVFSMMSGVSLIFQPIFWGYLRPFGNEKEPGNHDCNRDDFSRSIFPMGLSSIIKGEYGTGWFCNRDLS